MKYQHKETLRLTQIRIFAKGYRFIAKVKEKLNKTLTFVKLKHLDTASMLTEIVQNQSSKQD